MDKLTQSERSSLMARIRSKDSQAELVVRSMVHRMGFRYRLHSGELPGTPDLVFPGRSKIIFVHGCFWHGHSCRAGRNRPASHESYWNAKLERNMKRDRSNVGRLRRTGWRVLIVWECQVHLRGLEGRLRRFLEN